MERIRHGRGGVPGLAATGVLVLAAAAVIAGLLPTVASADISLAGGAGFATFPPTDSAVTVSGHDRFKDLTVTVGQTKHLINQAISVTWTGGRPTTSPNGTYIGQNYLQIFQCWSDPDPALSGPRPENCVYGGYHSDDKAQGLLNMPGDSPSRVMQRHGVATPDDPGVVDPYGNVWKPFRAVDGTETPIQKDENAYPANWLNKSFDANTTNEIPAGVTSGQGTGTVTFTADTAIEQPGLGCGRKVLAVTGGSKTVPRCWLVVVPRGTVAEEGSNPVSAEGVVGTSPLARSAWQNRIAVPLEFNPVDSPCGLGADERRIAGSELAVAAVTSWQPVLCATPGAPPYNYSSISDLQARNQLVRGGSGAAGMAVVSRPVDPTSVDPANPVVYAPLTLSGVTIGFNLMRTPITPNGVIKDPAEAPLKGTNVADIRLTPRVVAKLLSQSYYLAFSTLSLYKRDHHPGYEWLAANPDDVVSDPDFQQFNPEFQNLRPGETTGWLLAEETTSDAARQLWSWILADKEATTWLSGTPDPWGMKVNPYYNTRADLNAAHVPFGDPLPDDYPASDPYCGQSPDEILRIHKLPRPECLLDVQPLFNNMEAVAVTMRAGISGKKSINNEAITPDAAYVTGARQVYPNVKLMGITDSASATRFGLQAARLSAAGDDGPTRAFAAPDLGGLLAGVRAMAPSAVPEVLQPTPTATGAGAYPLTMLTYAAVTPRSLAPASRPDYAALVDYAVGPGQVPGYSPGQLPPGYAPLPAGLVDQAKAAAVKIRSGDPALPDATGPAAGPAAATPPAPPASANAGAGQTGATDHAPVALVAPVPPAGPPLTRPGRTTPLQRTLRTIAAGVGAIRYTLPVAIVIAVLAGGGAWLVRRRRPTAAPSGPTSAGGPVPPPSPEPPAHGAGDAPAVSAPTSGR